MICKRLLEKCLILIFAILWSWIQDQANAQDFTGCAQTPWSTNPWITSMCKDEPMPILAGRELWGRCFRDKDQPGSGRLSLSCLIVRVEQFATQIIYTFENQGSSCTHMRAMRLQVFDKKNKKNFDLGSTVGLAQCPNWYPESFVSWYDQKNVLQQARQLVWTGCSPDCNSYDLSKDLVVKYELIYHPTDRTFKEIEEFSAYRQCYPLPLSREENADCTALKSTLQPLPPPPPPVTTTATVPTSTPITTTTAAPTSTQATTTKTSTPIPKPTKIHKFDDDNDIFSGCGVNKFCISFEGPKGCIAHGTCSNLITFGEMHNERPKKDEAVVEILGSSKYWIALGISKDPYVGRDTLIECLHSGMSGDQVIHFNTYLKSRTEIRRIDEESFSYGIANLIHAHIDSADRMYCKFYIKHKFVNPISQETFSLKEFKHYFYILEGQEGRAKMSVSNKAGHGWLVPLKEEDITSFHLTKVPFNIGLRNLPYPNEEEHLTEHGKIMIVLYGLLIPTEWAFIRYFPFTLLKRVALGPFRYQAWYYIFHILNTIIVGFIAYGLMELDPALSDWLPVEARNPYHSATGHMAATMFIVLLFACFYHAQWNSKKSNGGHTLVKATVFLGYFLGAVTMEHVKWIKHSGATCYTGSLHRWWIFVSVVYHLLMSSFQYWIGKFIKLTKIQKKELVTIGRWGALYQYGPQFKTMPGLKVRWVLFVIYIGMGGLFSYLMIGSLKPGHTCVAGGF